MPATATPAGRNRTDITNIRHSPADLYRMNTSGALNAEATKRGVSLSALLEAEDPTGDYPTGERTLDAFGRVMKQIGVRTVSLPVQGVWADRMEPMFQPENRGFLIEWVRRRWAEARFGQPANPYSGGFTHQVEQRDAQGAIHQRNVMTSADEGGLGSVWRPYFDIANERASQLTPAIPLSLLVATQTSVDGDAVRMAYMTDPSAADLRMYRVGETAEIPLAQYQSTANEVRLLKYGRGIEISYEKMRRDRMDRVAFWIQRQAIQNENDKVEQAVDVLINGDGNSNAATNHNKTAMQGGAGGDALTLRGWLTFLAQFYPDYNPTLAFARLSDYVDILTLTAPNQNPPASTTGYIGGVAQVRPLADQTVRLGRLEVVPANTVVTIDPRFALEHLMELGANITESDKFITRQTQVVVMTETEGFDVLDKKATRTLTTNA